MRKVDEQLFQAVRNDKFSEAEKVLLNGASANCIEESKNQHTRSITPVLYVACKNKNENLVRLLLEHGADPNEYYKEYHPWGWEKEPCFHGAFPSVSITRLLLENGADPALSASWGEDCFNVVSTLEAAKNQSRNDRQLVELIKQYQTGES